MVESEHTFVDGALKRRVELVLDEWSIYDISSYGWISENDPDPEFIGHAMWQIDQPPLEHSALFGEAPVRRRPKDIEKEILICGEDFSGLMGDVAPIYRTCVVVEMPSTREPNE